MLIWECAAVFCNDLDHGGILTTRKTFILHVGGAKFHFYSSFHFCWNTIHNVWGCHLVFKASLRFGSFTNLYRCFVMVYINMAFQALYETLFLHVGVVKYHFCMLLSFCFIWNAIHNIWGWHLVLKANLRFCHLRIYIGVWSWCTPKWQSRHSTKHLFFMIVVLNINFAYCCWFHFCWNTIHNIGGCHLVLKASLRFCSFKNLYSYFVMM